jgi:hypothetical protein
VNTETKLAGDGACVRVDPGICGFACTICARKLEARKVEIDIEGSECKQIKRLSEMVTQIGLRDIFLPLTRNPVFVCAEKAGCHPSCAIPTAIIKVAEVALGLALKRDVVIQFKS